MYKRLLVAFDGSEQSYKALDHAVAIADKFRSEITLLTVVPFKINTFFPDDGAGMTTAINDIINYQDRIRSKHHDILTNAEAKVRSEHADMNVSTLLMDGRPSDTIVYVAEKEGCDLIVMGSRGIGGIKRLMLGSISHRVSSSCKKPVMIIK